VQKTDDIKVLAEKAYTLGHEYEKTYGGCCQCTIAALQDTLDMRNDDIFKTGTGLAGGVGGFCDTGCAAYIGGALFVSSLIGRERDDFADSEGNEFKAIGLVGKLHHRFINEYGTAVCRNMHMKLFGRYYYLHDEDEWAKFENDGGHTEVCPEVVGKAARWVVEILGEEGLIPFSKKS
jgi:hypothetical protein